MLLFNQLQRAYYGNDIQTSLLLTSNFNPLYTYILKVHKVENLNTYITSAQILVVHQSFTSC